jgi:hypothetical protein
MSKSTLIFSVTNKLASSANKTTSPLAYLMGDHLCIMNTKLVQELSLAVLYVSFPCKKKYIYSECSFYDHHGLFQQTIFGAKYGSNHKFVLPLIPYEICSSSNMS